MASSLAGLLVGPHSSTGEEEALQRVVGGQFEPSRPAHAHPHGEVLALDVGRRNVLRVRAALDDVHGATLDPGRASSVTLRVSFLSDLVAYLRSTRPVIAAPAMARPGYRVVDFVWRGDSALLPRGDATKWPKKIATK